MKRYLKRVLRVVLLLVAVLVILVIVLMATLGPVVRTAVNSTGPKALGVPVSVEHVAIRPLRGIILLRNLTVGNPPGFSSPHLFKLAELRVDIATGSLLTDRIHVREVLVKGPEVWYERKLTTSNIGALEEILGAGKEAGAQPAEPEEGSSDTEASKPAKRVVIDRLRVQEGSVGLKVGVGGRLPMPAIELKDIGKDDPDGITFVEATQRVLTAVFQSIASVISAGGDLAIGGAKAVGSGVVEGGALIGKGVGVAGEAVGSAGQAVGSTVDSAGQAIGGTVESAGQAIGGTVDSVGKLGGSLMKGVGGLFGGGEGKDKADDTEQ